MLKELRRDQKDKIIQFLRGHPCVYVGEETDCFRFVEGVRWMVRTGAQWRALPARYGHWNSVYKRFARWCEHGIWLDLLAQCTQEPDLEWVILDSSVIRAHPCAAGASTQSGGQAAQALGYSRGGFSTKIHVVVDALGNPLDFVLTPGQRHESGQAPRLLQGLRYDYVIGDKSYDDDKLIQLIQDAGAMPVIPARQNRTQPREYDKHLYQERHLVECFFNKIKWFRRIFARFDKLDRSYLGFLAFVSALIWLR